MLPIRLARSTTSFSSASSGYLDTQYGFTFSSSSPTGSSRSTFEKPLTPLEGSKEMAMAMVARLHVYDVHQMLSLSLTSSDSAVQHGVFFMVPHVLSSPAACATFQLLPVGREGCRVVHDMCKAVQWKTSTCSTLKAKRSRAHREAGQSRRVRGVTRRSEPQLSLCSASPRRGWVRGV